MNKTQCPHCFTVYVISDEQYRASHGMVRCGTCRERFQAQVSEEGNAPQFDPRRVFIEPLSEHEEKPKVTVDDLVSQSPEIAFREPNTNDAGIDTSSKQETEPSNTPGLSDLPSSDLPLRSSPLNDSPSSSSTSDASKHQASEQTGESSINIEFKADHRSTKATSTTEASKKIDGISAIESSIQTLLDSGDSDDASIEKSNDDETVADEQDQSENEQISIQTTSRSQQRELELPLEDKKQRRSAQSSVSGQQSSTVESLDKRSPNDDDKLIDAVDELIDDKIIGAPQPAEKSNTRARSVKTVLDAPSQNFELKPKPRRSLSRFFKGLFLAFLGALLSCALIYQLWLKQLIHWPDRPEIQELVQSVSPHLESQLTKVEIQLPTRRSLSQLALLSARTEAHPSRPSTTLLKVSLINRARIRQPLPWLELALTDGDGRLVSRRSLSPSDYVYNNRIDGHIGPMELKKITIELLTFPKHATGYELKLLNTQGR